MKFENILHIYWTKGLFVCSKLYYFSTPVDEIVVKTPGINKNFTKMLKSRFEFANYCSNNHFSIDKFENLYKIKFSRTLNILLSQVLSVNNNVSYLVRLRIIYQFLLKTYVGKAHAVGKPVHGQRTWSNSWTAYKYNSTLRVFISSIKKKSQLSEKKEKINFKLTKKKYGVTKSKYSTKSVIKKVNWF